MEIFETFPAASHQQSSCGKLTARSRQDGGRKTISKELTRQAAVKSANLLLPALSRSHQHSGLRVHILAELPALAVYLAQPLVEVLHFVLLNPFN
jgi:hypothetical protein